MSDEEGHGDLHTSVAGDRGQEQVEVGKPLVRRKRQSTAPKLTVAPAAETPAPDPEPPPRFSEQPAPLPPARVAPTRPPDKRRRAGAGTLTPDFMDADYRRRCPPELEGEELMKWYLAVQVGEKMERERLLNQVQDLAGICAVQNEILEQMQTTFALIREMGRGVGELVAAKRDTDNLSGLPVDRAPARVAPAQRPARAESPPPAGGLYDPAARRRTPARAEAEDEDAGEPEPGVQPFRSRAAKPHRVTQADADNILKFARSLVPTRQSPFTDADQLAIAEEQAYGWLDRWASEGSTIPDRWQGVIRGAIEDELFGRHEERFRVG